MYYAACYCEENIWHAVTAAPLDGVMFISNATQTVACFAQRAARAPSQPAIWDYHVIGIIRDSDVIKILDLDTTLVPFGHTHPWPDYYAATLAPVPPRSPFAARLAVYDATTYRQNFASDRRHMRTADGKWMAPPPPWSTIGTGHNLPAWIAATSDTTVPVGGATNGRATNGGAAPRWVGPSDLLTTTVLHQVLAC